MTKGEDTRREIVEKAAPLFNQKGFEGTSMSDLMRATGLEKGGIYRHFSSKEELASEAFDYAWQKAVERRLEGVDEAADAVERLKKMIDNFVDIRTGLVAGGCPLLNAAIDSDDGNPVIRERAREALRGWQARIAKVIRAGRTRGEIRKSVKPDELAALVISQLEGALMISRLNQSQKPLEWARDHLLEHLEGSVRAK